MADGVERITEKIKSFKKRYYLNILIRGVLLTLSTLVLYFLGAALLEYALWMDTGLRFVVFALFFGTATFCFYLFLKEPILWWIVGKGLDDQQSAQIIGRSMPSVSDRLLNLIQLQSLEKTSALAHASILQKTQELEPLSFESIIDFSQNRRYLKYLAIPVVIIIFLFFFNQNVITRSTERLVHFNRQFSPEAPFTFILDERLLTAFSNEDFLLSVKLEGTAIPENTYVVVSNQRMKMTRNADGQFSYLFEKIQHDFSFQLEAAGFYSNTFSVSVSSRPELSTIKMQLEYPRYIQQKNEVVQNTGSVEIPEGTIVKWEFNTNHTQKASILFLSDSQRFSIENSDQQLFTFSKRFLDADQYEIILENDKSRNKDKIAYRIDVVKDEFPKIAVTNFKDSVLYKQIVMGGNISDDYGVTELNLHFKIRDDRQKELHATSINIPITKNQTEQSFFYNWSVDSLKLKPGQQLEYYLLVWDNDGVNGRKFTRSGSYTFFVPSEDNLVAEIRKSQTQTQDKIDQSVSKAEKLQDQLEQANQKLKGKQSLDWRDKKMLEDIINQKENLEKVIDQMKEQNKVLDQKKDSFTKQDERIRKKAEEIQKLMDQLLDEETKKLFEELQKLLKENQDISQIQKVLDKLQQNSTNLEKELERTLELFKQLQYDFKLDQAIQEMKDLTAEQKELLEKTETLEKSMKENSSEKDKKQSQEKSDTNNKESQELAKEQESLKEEFKEESKKIEELKKLGDELNKRDQLPSETESESIQQEQEQSKEMLEQNNPSKAKSSQQKALKKMEDMQQQMEGMQNSMMMEMDMQNLEALRQIIHGLVKLSFDQEGLMKDFNDLQQSDPRFNSIAQRQLKLKDDAKVLEDSLLELGKRDPFMGSFITKEIGELNNHLIKVIESNKERRRPQASNEMQLSMTSINNLALMLDDHFDTMMQMMANAQPSMKKSKQKGQKPSLSQLQQQLNQKIQELKGSGKSGKQLSEELAEMAAEQERIRRALQEMENSMKKDGKNPGGDIPSKMEQTEMDLVNKNLTDQLIKRQQEILTRLLETEKSMREQDMDEERKGETAKDYEKEIPKAFQEYLRLKEKEVELLKTVPPKLYPYYKREVSEYFKRVGNQ